MAIHSKKSVIIVGAGPVGLLIAIRLGQQGINTLVLEKYDTLPRASRAVVYNPIVLGILANFDLLDHVMREAYLNTQGATWRNLKGEVLAHLKVDSDNPDEFGGVLLIGQARMNDIFLESLKKYPTVEVRFGAGCTGVENLPSSNTVKVMTWQRSNGEQDISYEADYVIGADGTGSSVRRCLCIPSEGYTWPNWKMVSTHVQYNFAVENNWGPITAIVDPVYWAVIIITGEDVNGHGCKPEDSVWRVSFGEEPDLPNSKEAIIERAYKRVAKYTKAAFKIVSAEPYYLQQRCAAQARKGRVMLAGDALHANNPSGGLGLTTGICDAYCYGNALGRVINDGESDDLLTECANARRDAWLNVTNPTSIMNFKRDSDSQDEDAVRFRNMFFGKLNHDPEFSKQIRKGLDKLLTKNFEKPQKTAEECRDLGFRRLESRWIMRIREMVEAANTLRWADVQVPVE